MKIKIALILCISLFVYKFSLKAQNIDRADFVYSYIYMPLEKMDSSLNTYYVNIKPKNTQLGNTLGNIYDAEKIEMLGYHRLESPEDADLKINLEVINDLLYQSATAQSDEFTYKKNKETPEITYTAYWYTISYYSPRIICRTVNKAGKTVFSEEFGGREHTMNFGSTSYGSHYSNQYSLAAAWNDTKSGKLMKAEMEGYNSAVAYIKNYYAYKCPFYSNISNLDVAYIKQKKGQTLYTDLIEAKDLFLEAVSLFRADKIVEVNRIIRSNYETRREKMKQAIAIWEKALEEVDYNDKKARIDKKVARRIYYNLSMAYLFIDDFENARKNFLGRKDDLETIGKNMFTGVQKLEEVINSLQKQYEANTWRPLLLSNDNPYVYKDPATRQKEMAELEMRQLAAVKAKQDSLSAASKISKKAKPKTAAKSGAKPVTTSKKAVAKKS